MSNVPINEIICGHNVDVLAGFPAECIDMTCTSPPYDQLRAYRGYTFDFEGVAQQLYRVTKPGGVVVWVVADATVNGSETGTSFRQALRFMELGFNLHDTMIYRTSKPPLNDRRYQAEFEYMFILSKGQPKAFNPLKQTASVWTIERRKTPHIKTYHRGVSGEFTVTKEAKPITEVIRGNVWDIKAGYANNASDIFANQHPAIFPEKLAEDHILSWSNPDDIVLDCFIGSGTTAKMAIKHHRRYIGIDIAPEYCELARKRIAAVQPTMFDMAMV